MRHNDKKVAEALDVLGFKYVGRDEDGEVHAFAEWPSWDDEDGIWYSAGRSILIDVRNFKALLKGYSQPLAYMEYDKEDEMYEI